MKKFAIIYDFDKTLSPKDMQEYNLLQSLGFNDTAAFWQAVNHTTTTVKCDPILSYMYQLKTQANINQIELTRNKLESFGQYIEFFDGLESWFERINDYGLTLGLQVEHYVVSSGLYEIISHTKIAKYFKQIYACSYMYDDNGNILWPRNVVNYTTKTQYIFRINKQVLDISNEKDLNAYIPYGQREIPFTRMIYIADGYTDVPVFKLIKEYGGHSIGVYNQDDKTVKQLFSDNRLNAYVKADYSSGCDLEKYVQTVLQQVSYQEQINDFMRHDHETN